MALKYSSKYDISYINYNNKNIPWQINTSFISQNNQNINPSLNIGSINNNLLIESSQNDIVLRTPQNKRVFVNNSMTVNANLDVSNNLTTSEVVVEDISLNNRLYLPSLPINIIGNLRVHGAISVVNSRVTGTGLLVSKSEFTNVTLTSSNFTDVSIVNCNISVSDFSNININNSYIYGIPIGYDISNNRVPNEAIFSDISLENLILDSSLNGSSYINFSNIIIKSSDDYSKLEISKPLNVELKEGVTNISNISIFNGDISCNTLYYSQLFPDIRLNNYIDISIGQVSVSGNSIPSLNNTFNVGSSNNKFNTITSTLFIGELSGTALLANDLVKNLDMSFNTLDVYGTVTLNKKSLAQFVSGDLITNVAVEASFNSVNNNVTTLSSRLYSKQSFDLCLNTNFAKISLLESSFINLNNVITTIANSVYIKSDFDLCLNRNFIRSSDISAITTIVSSPSLIYPSLINLNNSLNKVVNASAVNELAFPYAITYIDDLTEDTNLKEAYSYRKTILTTTFNTTTTQTTTINYTYNNNNTRPVSGAQPNSLSEVRVMMWHARSNNEYGRTWNDTNGGDGMAAVYRNLKTYTLDRNSNTWTWHRDNANLVSGRRLAEIYSADDHAKIVTLLTQENLLNRDVWIGGVRIAFSTTDRTSSTWKWESGAAWSYTNWQGDEPGSNESHVRTNNIGWHDYNDYVEGMAIYMTETGTTSSYVINTSHLSWEQHRVYAISIGAELAVITNSTENEAVGNVVQNAGLDNVYIGGRRKSNSTNAYGITSADWEWHNGTTWSYSNFFRGGQTEQYEERTESAPITSQSQIVQQVSTNTLTADTNLSLVKLPLLTASANGSIVAIATAVNVSSIPSNTSSNTSANPVLISDITTGPVITRANSITTNTKIHSYTTTNITYSLNSGSTSGLFSIYNNSNNNSSYIKSSAAALPSTITTSYSCIAITNDGMFVALGKASDVTVYMRNSTDWTALGTSIGVNFSAYTETSTGIILTQFADINWTKNLQNLAISYISGENQPIIFLAFGDSRNSVKIYSYDNGNWTLSNGFYNVAGGNWVLKHTHLASTLGASNNFGYFVVLSHNPRILVFSVDDRFYSYNCSDSSFNSRGSNAFIRLPTGVTNFTNIIALKITADADKVIVSNSHYVFIYKWNTTSSSWTQVTVLNVVPLSQQLQPIIVLQGTGGTITTNDGYIIHSFTTVGTSTFIPAVTGNVEVLIVGGGGGGGGASGGGGGGGGVIYMPSVSVTAGTNYPIVVGDGGVALNNGENSSVFGATAAGGGTSGTHYLGIGTTGGSGGGAAAAGGDNVNQGGASSGNSLGSNSGFIYGNRGGNMTTRRIRGPTRAAGGGGAGGQGIDTDPNIEGDLGQTGGGAGGVGIVNPILGPSYYWGGGGGGGGFLGFGEGWGGLGGGGGGGGALGLGRGGGSALNSGQPGSGLDGGAGGNNTGGGGGGCGWVSNNGGKGGSGIVIIRYLQILTPNFGGLIGGTRSVDISNISTNNDDCVFAIGFPDSLINSRANNRSRGYVEYYQYANTKVSKLATLVPRKRDITNNNVDTNEYFFSIGGIKITNANTILVSPNYKYHFYSTNKNYEYNSTSRIWIDHSSNAITVTGRRMASIENELEQELVRINARNNQLWLGGRRRASSVSANGTTSLDWEWISSDSSWNYVNWFINQPDNVGENRLHLFVNGTWNDLGENASLPAMYMTRSLSYMLNTFVIFDKFFFHSSGFFSSYFPTDVSNSVIARWATTDTPLNRFIEIRASGQIFSRSYGALSDIRLKENIVDVTPKLVDLLKVRVVNYNLQGCKDANATFIGVVAQELEQIFPALVKEGDLSPQDIHLGKTETYKYVKYSCFDIMLIKAFQEQMEIINKLSSQVTELDSKTKLLKTISQYNVILNEDLDFLKRENELLKQKINIITKLITKC